MRNKRNQSEQNIVVIADGEFYAPNLIRTNDDWMGIPVQWLHLVPNRNNLKRVKIVLHLEYHGGNEDAQAQD